MVVIYNTLVYIIKSGNVIQANLHRHNTTFSILYLHCHKQNLWINLPFLLLCNSVSQNTDYGSDTIQHYI